MIPLTTLEAAARVAAHAAGRSARLHTGPAVLSPGEDRASPSDAGETTAAPAPASPLVRRSALEPVRGRGRGPAPGPMRGPMRGTEQSADDAAGMLLRTG
jgi:hypothetical protein